MVRRTAGAILLALGAVTGAAQAQEQAHVRDRLYAQEQEPRSNVFGDPFGQVLHGLQGCPAPAGPMVTAAEARRDAHWRAERGTSCYRSGRCRLPNAYLYDSELYPRLKQYLEQDPQLKGASIWVTVQRRWVTLQGCVLSAQQGAALEAAVRQIDDVEAVVGEWMVGAGGKPVYEVAGPGPAAP